MAIRSDPDIVQLAWAQKRGLAKTNPLILPVRPVA